MSASSNELLTEKVRTLQKIVDDQMEALIQKELTVLKLKEERVRDTADASAQTSTEPLVEKLMREIGELRSENGRLMRELRAANAANAETIKKVDQAGELRAKLDKLRRENESLMELMQKNSFQTQKGLSVS